MARPARRAGTRRLWPVLGTLHVAMLRGAISGKRKSDVIATDVLPLASDVFELSPLDPP